MTENTLREFCRGFVNRNYTVIEKFLSFFDESSSVNNLFVNDTRLENNWQSIVNRVSSDNNLTFQNTFEITYDVDDLLRDFLQTYIETVHLYYQGKYPEALDKFTDCLKDFTRLYKAVSNQYRDDWLYIIYDLVCYNLRELAVETNINERQKGENKEYLEAGLNAFATIKQEMNRLKTADTFSHKMKLLTLVETHLDWINYKLRNYKSVKDGIRSLADLYRTSDFSLKDVNPNIRVKFLYNWGKIALLTGRIPIAIEKLEGALALCPSDHEKNARLILKYLCIAKVLNGQKLNKKLLEKYNLKQYFQLTDKIAKGDLQGYHWEMHFRLIRWVKAGLVLLFDNFRSVIYRNLLRKWNKVTGSNKITFAEFKKVLELKKNAEWHHEYSENEILSILSNLVSNGYIKGTVSINDKVINLRAGGAFPKLREINIGIQDTIQKNSGENL